MNKFKVVSDFEPCGDQPEAISGLVKSIENNNKYQTLLGVTGSGKTFTMAKIIEEVQKPTLVIAHNKTLVGQLYSEFKEFFPNNAVEYFVSYYDYYQPEAYIPSTDTFIEKDSSVNEEIDKLRHSATAALIERKDVIIVASVSCIYGLGDPQDYETLTISLRPGMKIERDMVIKKLVELQYDRNDIDFTRSRFRVRGDVLEVFPASYGEEAIRVEFFGDEIDKISQFEPLTGKTKGTLSHLTLFPASHFATTSERMENAVVEIKKELIDRIKELKEQGKLIEAQRIEQRTLYDIDMMTEMGYCQGIENYSRYISGREAGSPPYSLLDYFPDDFLVFIDESHVSTSQIGAMYSGDRSRKENLVNFGFRLPSAFDNRPLMFDEFINKTNQILFVSATPAKYEYEHSKYVAEQIIRPTGLVDPIITIHPLKNQVDDLMNEIKKTVDDGFRVLVTTLTKRMAEDLTSYLEDLDFRVRYLHSDVETLERIEIIRSLRMGEFDVLVGINLLREGLDLPEVALVAILDADKQGFLRSTTALIQTVGRASRNTEGRVLMYADSITSAMRATIDETSRRREKQIKYNLEQGITPKTIIKGIRDSISTMRANEDEEEYETHADKEQKLMELEFAMENAARELDFENAAKIRDEIKRIMGAKK